MSFDRWGCQHGKDAIEAYCTTVSDKKHHNFVISSSGLVLDTVRPHLLMDWYAAHAVVKVFWK